MTCAAVGACVIGLLGVDVGLLWLVAGVWTIRAMAGAPLGLAWGIACMAVGLRWGTTSLGDVAVATRLAGPTVAAGPLVVRVGMIAALVGAVLDEARAGALRGPGWNERAAAGISVAALVALFVVRGPGDPATELPVLWAALAVVGTTLVLQLHRVLRPMPPVVPVAVVAAGTMLGVAGA